MTFATRIITPTITIGSKPLPVGQSGAPLPLAQFQDTNTNTVTLSGYRCHADIQANTGQSYATATLRIYGLPLSRMNELAVSNWQMQAQPVRHTLSLAAGDSVNGVQTVYTGQVQQATIDAAGQPDVPLVITSAVTGLAAVVPKTPVSFKGSVNVTTIVAQLAEWMGWQLETNGVSVVLTDPYLWGSPKNQMADLCRAAHIEWTVDDTTNPPTLAIWPMGGARGGTIPLISPQTGMVASPQFDPWGVTVTCAFNPNIRFGQHVQVESMIKNACGTFKVWSVQHTLDSETPGGAWFTTLACHVLYERQAGAP